MADSPENESPQLKEVWRCKLDQELAWIGKIVDKYSYIAMDTEFPGYLPSATLILKTQIRYDDLRTNVNGTNFWQFNFCEFNVHKDAHNAQSIKFLHDNGIDFVKNNEEGIDAVRFGEFLTSSGIVMNCGVHLITFQGAYDLGYLNHLIKLLSGCDLPETQADFMEKINAYFPIVYDVKHLMEFKNLHGGLNFLADVLGVERVGVSHQAGSDSLVTCRTFLKLKETYFNGQYPRTMLVFCMVSGIRMDTIGDTNEEKQIHIRILWLVIWVYNSIFTVD
ncbi:polynucleotidyl transferase, ribonuclease H-like superfamily protein [Actinidia rufa]|uniref:poly(A)-specific ribonuclease n=1 Tax=Actinidia rufa TaxID=165716 RepID=A0A7J0DNR0_9ERIC|nr:polynucleotidyl transferase, ribonuclease H-like superfamily protein [Actinidia rufa]